MSKKSNIYKISPKKIYIRTYGCQMNLYDSEAMEGLLMEYGFVPSDKESEADVILLNTCSVRDLAEKKVLGKIGLLAKLKRTNPDLVLGICGCMAQNMKQSLFRKFPALDLICGPNDLLSLPEMILQALKGRKRLMSTENTRWVMSADIPKNRKGNIAAWVTVMKGCNHACTFCIVPKVRGKEISRTAEDILREVKELALKGYKEVTLLGQNINSYGRDLRNSSNFPKLLECINGIGEIHRVRFTTSHPVDIRDGLIDAIARLEKVCEALHFPAQSGSDRILKAMRRGYTQEQYLAKVQEVRDRIPGVAISTDIIVGFPGETDEDFLQTCRLMEEAQFDMAYLFKYSKRSGTPAADMDQQIPEEVKENRHRAILKLQEEISFKKNQNFVGKALEILVEGQDSKNPGKLYGRSRDNRLVFFNGTCEMVGGLFMVMIQRATAFALYGENLL